MVYLLHFSRPYHHARHYLGSTDLPIDQRMQAHRTGHGARLCAVVTAAGIDLRVVRMWTGDRKRERQLKNQHNAPRLCPICRGAK